MKMEKLKNRMISWMSVKKPITDGFLWCKNKKRTKKKIGKLKSLIMVWNNRLLAHCTGKHIFEFGEKSKWNTKKSIEIYTFTKNMKLQKNITTPVLTVLKINKMVENAA